MRIVVVALLPALEYLVRRMELSPRVTPAPRPECATRHSPCSRKDSTVAAAIPGPSRQARGLRRHTGPTPIATPTTYLPLPLPPGILLTEGTYCDTPRAGCGRGSVKGSEPYGLPG